MKYPKFTSTDVAYKDFMNNGQDGKVAQALKDLPFIHVTPSVVAGASDTTVLANAFIAPTKLTVGLVRFIMGKVQTGSGNTPVVKLINLTQTSAVMAASDAIALSGTIGNVTPVVIDAEKATADAGDVLQVAIVNPAGTITVALEGKFQIEWNSVV